MDLSVDSGTPPAHTAVGGPVLEQELSMSGTHGQTESGGTILLQLLEFKTHLLEAIEELYIRRDAETRFEDQISKLVLEKQELEWEKESLQHQSETVANQHTESLINVKKQFQAKIRNIEEEKGKYQVSAELKDKEINNLKEELKSLQLQKYNLEKKLSELEQKLALQSRSKDSHLKQLGEVEKRFSALSRQCAIVKQAHEKLEQNVDEAMNINKKLSSANGKQEATIVSLKKELEEVSKKLIKAKMSSVRHDKTHSPTGREQRIQQLHQKLNMETEMNKRLSEENVAVRAEKQEVLRSLQHTQQLLLSQTQTVSRVELELQTQREQYQGLKQEHGVMREKSKAMEDKVAQLMESFAASMTSWDKEKAMFLDRIKSEQQDLQAVKEAYEELHQKHTELSSQAKVQAQHIDELEVQTQTHATSHLPTKPMRDSCQQLSVSSVEEIRREETLPEPIPSSDGWKDDVKQGKNNRGEEERNKEQQWNREKVQGEDAKEGGSAGEQRGMLTAQTTDRADRREDSQRSTEDAGYTKQAEAETKDRAEERGKTGLNTPETPETQMPAQTATDRTTEKSKTLEVIDFMDTEPPLAAGAPSACSKGLSQKVSEEHADSSHVNKGYEITREVHTLCSDEHRSVSHGPTSVIQEVQRLCRDKVQTFAESLTQPPSPIHQVFEKTTEEKPFNKLAANIPKEVSEPLHQSSLSSSHTNTAPLAAQSVGSVSIQELETSTPQPSNPSDITSDMRQTDEMCDTHVSKACVLVRTVVEPQALAQSQEMSEQESGQLKSLVTEAEGGAHKKREAQSNVDTRENDGRETSQEPMEKSDLKEACVDITMDTVDLESEVETGSCQEPVKIVKIEDAGDTKTTKHETDLMPSVRPSPENDASPETGCAKCYEQSPAKAVLLDDTSESSLPSNMTYRSSFDWGSAQRKTVSSRTKSDVSVLHQFVQGPSLSEQSTSDAGGVLGHPPNTIPMSLKSKHNKVPSVITRASDLLDASSVSGTASSSGRHPQGETCRETATADMESRASLSISSFPVSASSITVSRLSWQTTPGRATTPAAGLSSESDWEPSCSQEREVQQSSFRAQITKIEQFLNTERLRLPKRRRTDN